MRPPRLHIRRRLIPALFPILFALTATLTAWGQSGAASGETASGELAQMGSFVDAAAGNQTQTLGARYGDQIDDEEGGLNAGGALNFLMIDRRVRFEVSLTAADRAGLKVRGQPTHGRDLG